MTRSVPVRRERQQLRRQFGPQRIEAPHHRAIALRQRPRIGLGGEGRQIRAAHRPGLRRAVHEEGSVTRAAQRLGITQSAASNALSRLRMAFADELFQRTPGGMEPTALARDLAAPIRAALDAVREAVELNRPFDPASARDEFVVGVSDYAEFVLGPALVVAGWAGLAQALTLVDIDADCLGGLVPVEVAVNRREMRERRGLREQLEGQAVACIVGIQKIAREGEIAPVLADVFAHKGLAFVEVATSLSTALPAPK